ncbi:EamA domain-containing membrane protein RarD [Flavobacteriaceae bacterium MAR_2010_72]|nr:EamA domain-containing membrane protein RarD [Flavobacteriaceae bacterium MAR_2010_72]TVZ58127.1 EamA domain-containing membrane protein RarD [Flavobacteriaceae bacterium MAR_2010_105]
MDKRTLALLAAFGASAIYGINHTVAKGLMPTYIQPYGFILLRVLGAAILFWIISIWSPKERVEKKDWLRLLACAIFGMAINMLMFFKGLSLSTPINSSVMITISPIIIFLLSVLILKERITILKIVGILIGFGGALSLILFTETTAQNAENIPLGNTLFLINATSYAIYLILIKPLTAKYHVITLMKWLFLFGVVINLPITLQEFQAVDWQQLPMNAIFQMAFVVVGTTFLTYLLNVFALKQLNASTIGVFMYLQPLLGILYAILAGSDTLNVLKVFAAGLVFLGVYLVTKRVKSA